MADRAQAVRRVAINEICFGITLLVGPVIGNQFYGWWHSIARTYLATAVFLAVGVAVQTWLAARILAKTKAALQ
jgi:hypothetical protein